MGRNQAEAGSYLALMTSWMVREYAHTHKPIESLSGKSQTPPTEQPEIWSI